MRVVLRYLKRLPNGKFQYRRAWPPDVREVRPELPWELKRNFTSPDGSEREAIRIAQEYDRYFEKVQREARQQARSSSTDWRAYERVRNWFETNKTQFEEIVVETPAFTEEGEAVIDTTTAGEIIAETILSEAAKREGYGIDGHPKRLTLEEELKVQALLNGEVPQAPLTIKDAYDAYKERHLGGRDDKATDTAYAQFVEFAGVLPLSSITRRTVYDWNDWLMSARGQASATIKRRLGAMKAIVNFACDRELFDGKNPFERMKPPQSAKAPEYRLPFHRKHLAAIDAYLREGKRVRPETRHLIALLRYTGCRPSEIGGLKVEDLQFEGPIPYAMVRWTDDRRLKTRQSQRRVPLIGEALEAAKALATTRKSGWLFPKLAPKDVSGNENPALSARVNKAIRAAGVPNSRRLVAYSFRHTMAEALDQVTTISHKARDRVLGRGKPDQYGAKEQPLEVTLDAMNAAIPLLGRIDEVMYEPWMLEIGARDRLPNLREGCVASARNG